MNALIVEWISNLCWFALVFEWSAAMYMIYNKYYIQFEMISSQKPDADRY